MIKGENAHTDTDIKKKKNTVFGGRLTPCNRSDNYEKMYDISVAIAPLVSIFRAIKHTGGLSAACPIRVPLTLSPG